MKTNNLETIKKPFRMLKDFPLEASVRVLNRALVPEEKPMEEDKRKRLGRLAHPLGRAGVYLILLGAAHQSTRGNGRSISPDHLR